MPWNTMIRPSQVRHRGITRTRCTARFMPAHYISLDIDRPNHRFVHVGAHPPCHRNDTPSVPLLLRSPIDIRIQPA
jgi:hypothetical protein